MENLISAFFFPSFRVFIGLYSKTRKRKRGNSLCKSRLPGSSFIPKNRRRLCLLAPFYLVLSEDYILRDFRGFPVFDLALKVAEEELKFVKRLPTVLVKERKKDRQREWKEKTLHGQFLRETEEHANRSRWQWLKAGELKRGTESLICAAQEQALRTNSVAYSIDKTSTTPLCRLCKEKTESVTHIVSACSNLAKNQYRKRHDKLGKKIHWLLCKKFLIDCNEKWFLHEPEQVQENERWKLLSDFTIQTDKVLEHRRPDIVIIDKEKKECILIDFAVPGDQYITAKEQEKIAKYQDLRIEIEK